MKYEETAKRLREALTDNNMTAQELCNKTGINKSSISGYVNGSHTIGNVKAYKIAEVLSVNPMWLMGFDVSKHEAMATIDPVESYNKEALAFYAKYLGADRKTRKMIDLLLEEGDDDGNC